MKYCQGPKCHEYRTKDRIRGPKGDKHYETRKRTYLFDLFCDNRCWADWMTLHGKRAVDHFGRIHEPKRTDASGAWYKFCKWISHDTAGGTQYRHYFVNDLLGQRVTITEQQYQDENFTSPTN
jgi:hypothetical protein